MIHQILTVPELIGAYERAKTLEFRAKADVMARPSIHGSAWTRYARAAADRHAIAHLLRYVRNRPERTV